MVDIRGALSGTHPFGEDLIQSVLDFKYGRADKEPVKQKFQKELQNLIDYQKNLQFPIVSVGSYGIEDLIRPFTKSLESLKSYQVIGDLPIVRYHYTNTFFRQPTLIGQLPDHAVVVKNATHTLSDENAYSHSYLKGNQAKIVLPGPLTFSKFVNFEEGKVYKTQEEFILEASTYLAKEIESLPEQYVEVQLEEPVFIWERVSRDLWSTIGDAYRNLAKNTSKSLMVPVDGVGIDFLKTNILRLAEFDFSGKVISAGVVDAQNFVPGNNQLVSRKSSQVLSSFTSIIDALNPKGIVITPTTGLEYLPREIADDKLKQISEIVNTVQEVLN